MSVIEYFYSAHSAFAYLGSRRFMEIAAAAGRRIEHRPVDLQKVIDGAGSTPTTERPRKFRAYFFGREIQRWAEHRAAPVVDGMPTHHWNDTTLANCMLVAGVRQEIDVDALAHALLEAHWRHDADLADRATLAEIGRGAGYDAAALLDATRSPEVQAAYAANTAEAIERSVFGSPTYFVDGDMFYGQDRLELVQRALHKPYAGDWPPAEGG